MLYQIRRECDRVKRIYKYNLPETGGVLTLNIPPIYQILKVGLQNNNPVFWVIVYPEEQNKKYQITGLWTGMEYEEKDGTYIGTLTVNEIVYHYFIREIYDGTR